MEEKIEIRSKIIQEKFKEELSGMRTGRANPGLVSNIQIEAYGVRTPLIQLANVNVSDARTLVVEPWDASLVKEIEKSITESGTGLSPVLDGKILRIKLPEMTEETRKNLVKRLGEKLEESKISVRQARDDEKKKIESDFKSGKITEDDRYDFIEKLDKKTKEIISVLEGLADKKEQEIMTI